MVIELTEDEALVLFELLHDFGSEDDGRRLAITHVAERNALWALAAALEKALEAPFRPNYGEPDGSPHLAALFCGPFESRIARPVQGA